MMTEESSNSQQLQRTKFVIEQKSVKKTFFQEHKTIIKQVRKRNTYYFDNYMPRIYRKKGN